MNLNRKYIWKQNQWKPQCGWTKWSKIIKEKLSQDTSENRLDEDPNVDDQNELRSEEKY